MKKNRLAAAVEMVGSDGRALCVGTVDFHVLHRASGLISGALLAHDGACVGQVSIKGVDLGALGGRRVGRPSEDEKKLAVFLAWALKCAGLRGKRTLADEETAKYFGYSDGKKVRDIRSRLVKQFGLDLDRDFALFNHGAPDVSQECSMLIMKPTYYLDDGLAKIVGIGSLWTEADGSRVNSGLALEIDIPQLEDPVAFSTMRKHGGPIIISALRPGQ